MVFLCVLVLSEAQMKEIQQEIEKSRQKLLAESEMDKEERKNLESDLKIREEELQKAR